MIERSAGPNHPLTAEVLETGAALFNAMGETDQAIYLHKRALRIYEDVAARRSPEEPPAEPKAEVETKIEVDTVEPKE